MAAIDGDTSSEFGFDADFESPLEPRFMCSICLAALRDPVQIICGHRFCYSCLKRSAGDNPTVRCPFHKDSFDFTKQIFHDNAMKREVLSLVVKCPLDSSGCGWKGELRDLKRHRRLCPKAEKSCPMCLTNVQQAQLEAHITVCPRRVELCPHCSEECVFEELFKHQVLMCPKFPVSCTLCGKEQLKREDIPTHVSPSKGDCPQVAVDCLLKEFGCPFHEHRCKLESHMTSSNTFHLVLLAVKVNELQRKIVKSEELAQVTSKQDGLEKELSSLTKQLARQQAWLEELETNSTATLFWKLDLRHVDEVPRSMRFSTGKSGYTFTLEATQVTDVETNFVCFHLRVGKKTPDFHSTCPVSVILSIMIYAEEPNNASSNSQATCLYSSNDPFVGLTDGSYIKLKEINITQLRQSNKLEGDYIHISSQLVHPSLRSEERCQD